MTDPLEKADFASQIVALGYQLVALAKGTVAPETAVEAELLATSEHGVRSVFKFDERNLEFAPIGKRKEVGRLIKSPLPDPRLIRSIIRQRRLRSQFFESGIFADPAWDILLDLAAARAEHKRVSVSSLCIASGVPPTTGLRWIQQLTTMGLLDRTADDRDRRRTFVSLSDAGADMLARYFAHLDQTSGWPI